MAQVVTNLVVDARGAEVGSAAYVKAMRAAQLAVDRTIDAHNRAQEAQDRATAAMGGQAGSISRSRAEWERLSRSMDPAIRAQRAIQDATLKADMAVRRGIATQQEAARIIDMVRQKHAQVTASTGGVAVANDNMASSFGRVMQAASAAVPGLSRFSGGLAGFGGLAGGVAAVASAVVAAGSAIAVAGDQYTRYGNLLQAAGVAAEQLGDRQQMLVDLALNTRTSLEPTVTLYAGLTRSTQELGKTQAEVARATETINKAFKLGGVSAESAAGAILQLNQAMAAGALRGDELNSVLEGAPPLARLIAKEFNVGIGELKQLGEEGQLSASRVFDAIVKGSEDIDGAFRDSKVTMQDAATNGVTAFSDLAAAMDEVLGISARVAGAMNGVAAEVRNVAAAIRELPNTRELQQLQSLQEGVRHYRENVIPSLEGKRDFASQQDLKRATEQAQEYERALDKAYNSRIRAMGGEIPGVPDPAAQFAREADKRLKDMIGPLPNYDEVTAGATRAVGAVSALAKAQGGLDKAFQDATRNGLKPYDRAVQEAQNGLAERKKIAEDMARSGVAQADVTAYQAKSEALYAKEVANASAAATRGGSSRSGANREAANSYDRLIERIQKQNAEMQIEIAGIGASTEETLKLKTARELERSAIEAKIPLTDKVLRQIDEEAGRHARLKTELDATQRAYEQLQEAQSFLGDQLSSFIEDLISGSGSLEDALKRLADTFLKSGLQALLTGEGPLAGILGTAATNKGEQGGLFGYLMGNDVKLFRDTVAKGTAEGVNKAIGTGGQTSGAAIGNVFGIDGKALMGGVTALASLGAAYGSGMSAGSVGMAGVMGGIAGGAGGLAMASSLASAGISLGGLATASVLGPIGLLAGAGIAIYGNMQQRKQQKEELRRQAQENYEAAKPQVAQLGQTFRGDELGNIQQQIQAGIDKLNELGPVLVNAGHVDELIALQNDYNTFVNRLKDEFRADFSGTIDELRAGLGAQGPFKQASDAVKQFGDSAKSFVADTATAFGEGAWQIQNARDASIDYALSMLDQAKTLTEVQQQIQSINGTAAGLSKVLQDLGMSAEDAANAINQRVGAAMDRLRSAFTEGLERRLNEASDMGYLNEMADQIAQYQRDLKDAAMLGLDRALVDQVFKAEAQAIVNGSQLVGAAFDDLIVKFPQLTGVVRAAAMSVAQLEAAATAQLDANVQEAQSAVDAARAALTAAYQAEASALKDTITRTEGYIKSLKAFRQSLLLDNSLSPLSPEQRLIEAQNRFNEVSQKALAGDTEAIGELEEVSRQYLEEARGFYASSEQYYAIFNQVRSILDATANKAETQLDTAKAQLAALDAQVEGLITVNDSVLSVTEAIAKLQETMVALDKAKANQAAGTGGTGQAGDWQETYVKGLYKEVFNREADTAGLAYWTGLLRNGTFNNATLYEAFLQHKANGAMRLGGIVGAYAGGGMVGNGIFDVDSVLARYAGGGSIALAGGEYVMPANQTRANLPMLEAMRAGRPANDDSAREEIRALRSELQETKAVLRQILSNQSEGFGQVARAMTRNAEAAEENNRQQSLNSNRR
ncbi:MULTISPECIES: tape measure protein [unclassified Chelatococcus]|uniref:tape measure protein n=1 Tax=unclassified Chelatococcus TaxID=2638111 RepID=UPI001BCE6C77|nr:MULTISPECIES: tape measure protein [unclassified Chelatococcus]MBS7699159.1 tape measure protein [Chelatococcus sp. YT9]MBX3554940.1 tape measure protein [Chelatococcus sp.]